MIQTDKLLHALATLALCFAIYGFCPSPLLASALALAIGLCKEIIDRHNSLKENALDMLANGSGALAFLLIDFLHRATKTIT